MSNRAAIYLRTATAPQCAQSLEQQTTHCYAIAERHNLNVLNLYEDIGASGLDATRQGLLALLKDAQHGHFDVLICEGFDRLARDNTDLAMIWNTLQFYQIKIIIE